RRARCERHFLPSQRRHLAHCMLHETFCSAWPCSCVSMASSFIVDCMLRFSLLIPTLDDWKFLLEPNGSVLRPVSKRCWFSEIREWGRSFLPWWRRNLVRPRGSSLLI